MFIAGFIIGTLFGALVGFVACALLVVGGSGHD